MYRFFLDNICRKLYKMAKKWKLGWGDPVNCAYRMRFFASKMSKIFLKGGFAPSARSLYAIEINFLFFLIFFHTLLASLSYAISKVCSNFITMHFKFLHHFFHWNQSLILTTLLTDGSVKSRLPQTALRQQNSCWNLFVFWKEHLSADKSGSLYVSFVHRERNILLSGLQIFKGSVSGHINFVQKNL